ncbi:MAG: beta-lactamase family protein [Anaerolineae bacterium]|nr:beta-lactamase family protein [Anaerolineae bacterium]
MSTDTQQYYPPPESRGGWRWLRGQDEIRNVAGMDLDRLELMGCNHELIFGGDSWGIVIIRNGYLVREFYTFNVLVPSRFDIWSGTKSFTGTAWGLLLEDSQQNRLPGNKTVDLDSRAYDFIAEGLPLTDPRKESITIRNLLTMTSGIAGEESGVRGMPTATEHGAFEHALGRCPNRYGIWTDKLASDPGTCWEYSDPAMAHLALAFAQLTGQEMSEFLKSRVFDPIGIEKLDWDVQGGSGFIGPHTNAHTGIHVSARELARFGYLMLRDGVWDGQQLIPKWWIDLATQSSQEQNRQYGYTWWVNTGGCRWPDLPHDLFFLSGYRSNLCYVVPSLDLVVARVGSGPTAWNQRDLLADVISAIVH